MKEYKTVGRRKMLRFLVPARFTQVELAARLSKKVGHISQAAISKWCRGEARPTPEFRQGMAVLTGGRIQPGDWMTAREKRLAMPVHVVRKLKGGCR